MSTRPTNSASTTVIFLLLICTLFVHQRSLVDADEKLTTVGVEDDRKRSPTTTSDDVVDRGDVTGTSVDWRILDDERGGSPGNSKPEVTNVNSPGSSSKSTDEPLYDDVTVELSSAVASNESETETEPFYEDYVVIESFWQYHQGMAILRYGLPVLLALTTIDNTLAVVVLQHSTFRGSPTCFILSALAIADMLVIYTGLLRLWVFSQFEFDFRTMSSNGCRFHLVFTYFSRQVA